MLFAIVAAWLAYNKAKESDRNGFIWALIAVAVYIGTQFVMGIAIGLIIIFAGGSEETIEQSSTLINFAAIGGSFAATFALLHFLGKKPKDEDSDLPPPPPSF